MAQARPATTFRALLGQVLQARRERAGLSQHDLADQVGLTQSAWSRVERGHNAISVEQLRRACRALGTESDALLQETDHVAESLRDQGIRVEEQDPRSPLANGLVLIGFAALATAVVAALFSEE